MSSASASADTPPLADTLPSADMSSSVLSPALRASLAAVIEFWFPTAHYQDFWFSRSHDAEIESRFADLLKTLETATIDASCPDSLTPDEFLAIVICYDQFSRNIYRNSDFRRNDAKCFDLVQKAVASNIEILRRYTPNKRIFLLLPYRHQNTTPNLDFVAREIGIMEEGLSKRGRLTQREHKEYVAIVKRFKNATMRNYSVVRDTVQYFDPTPYSATDVRPGTTHHLQLDTVIDSYNTILDVLDPVCDDFDSKTIGTGIRYDMLAMVKRTSIYKTMQTFYTSRGIRNVCVSLSGGVDSMVISYVLHHLRLAKIIDTVCAVHVDYGNRNVSLTEAYFVRSWCAYLRIPLIMRRIEHMRRDNDLVTCGVDRSVYESATKELRFNLYRYAMERYNCESVVLGHHQDDLSENVLMNVVRGNDLLDLFTMVDDQTIDGVPIHRPLLPLRKNVIYAFSEQYEVPYLKDTTSESCLRGVVRKNVIPSIEAIDPSMRSALMDIGRQSNDWRTVIDKMVLRPVIDKFTVREYGVTLPWDSAYSDLPLIMWTSILTSVFHTRMGVPMITHKNLRVGFVPWVKKIGSAPASASATNPGLLTLSNGYMCFFHRNTLCIVSLKMASVMQKLGGDDQSRPMTYDYDSMGSAICFNGWKITYEPMSGATGAAGAAGVAGVASSVPSPDARIELADLLTGKFEYTSRAIHCTDQKVWDRVGVTEAPTKIVCLTYGSAIDPHSRGANPTRKFFRGLDMTRYVPKIHILSPIPDDRLYRVSYSRI